MRPVEDVLTFSCFSSEEQTFLWCREVEFHWTHADSPEQPGLNGEGFLLKKGQEVGFFYFFLLVELCYH